MSLCGLGISSGWANPDGLGTRTTWEGARMSRYYLWGDLLYFIGYIVTVRYFVAPPNWWDWFFYLWVWPWVAVVKLLEEGVLPL